MSYLELARKAGYVPEATTEISPVAPEVLEGIHEAALDRLNDRCIKNPALLDKHNVAADIEGSARVESLWEQCLTGKATIEDFEGAVAKWEGEAISS